MEKLPKLDHDDANSLTTFNIIVEGDGEGLISKIFSKFKTAVSGPQQLASPSSSTRTISIVLSNESGMIVEDVNAIAKNQKSITPVSTDTTAPTVTSPTNIKRPLSVTENSTAPVIITKPPSTAPTSSSSKSTIKRIIIDEDQNQQQEVLYPPSMLIPLTKTPSCDSDTQSVMTTFSVSNTNSLSRILNRLRGESIDSNKDFWMPDEQCRECFDCNAPFNIFRRKHHCRTCGKIFCSKCLGNSIRTSHSLRVCNNCYTKFEIHKADDTLSIQDGYGYTSAAATELSPQLQQQQHQQKTFLLPNNNDDDSSDDEFERSTNSLEIQRPNIDLHFSQSTSSHHTTSDTDVGIKKLLTNTIFRSTPRSRTSTMNSLGIDTSLAALEGRQNQQPNSPMPFRRNSFITSLSSAHPDNIHHQSNLNHHGSHLNHMNHTGNNGTGTPIHHAEYYEVEDDDLRRWDKNPRNLLNFLGGGGNTGERPGSGIFNNIPPFFDDYPDSPTGSATPVASTSTSTTKTSWFMRPNPANERSNSIIRRRLSLSENNSNSTMNSGGTFNNTSNNQVATNPSTRHIRVRTKSLMRNTPITTASIMMETSNQSSSSGNESGSSTNMHYGTSPLLHQQYSNNTSSNIVSGGSNNGMAVARCTTPDLDHVRAQILSMTASPTPHLATVATHEQWDESYLYLMRNLLRHLLQECGVETTSHQSWEDVMMKLLLSIADEVQPNIRVKDTFNMNHYVKIKKVPGGLPKDSFSVSGVVLSKSLVHKDMIRKIENPRIIILNFELDRFTNSNSTSTVTTNGGDNLLGGPRQEYLKFDRLLAWERDYMNILVNQIIGLKPSIVLVAGDISRTIVERLNKAKIVVAYNIKKQKLDAIARVTDATLCNYNYELWNAKGIAPGKCGLFETLTVMHEFLPHRRKTFLMFKQCPKERGASVVLRGGDLNTLCIIKFIMKFMVTVVNNINLEAQLRNDFIELRRWNLPVYDDVSFDDEDMENSNDDSSALVQYSRASSRPNASSSFTERSSVDMLPVDAQSISALSVAESQMTVNTMDVAAAKKKAQQQYHQDAIIVEDDDICLTAINNVLKLYQNTTLSISPGVTLPVPHILLKLRDAQKRLIGLIRERLGPSIMGNVLSSSPLENPGSPESANEKGKDTTPVIPPIPTDLMYMPLYLKTFDAYLEHDLEYRHYQDLHVHAWYIFKRYIDGIHQWLSPIYHQEILVHRTTNPMNNHTIPCEKAVLEPYNYYDPTSDYTLGQYILNAAKEAYTICGNKMCEASLINHDKTYSHGNAQIKMQVFSEDDNGDEEPMEERIDVSRDEYLRKIHIFIRTKCHICKIVHSWKPMSDLLQRYSFGKFLELLFYQSESIPIYDEDDGSNSGSYFAPEDGGDDGCPHGLYRDHTISFRIQNLSVNFTHAMVKVVDVQPPPLHLRFSTKQQMAIKDASLDVTRSKIAKFFDSIIERNKAFSYDIVQPNMIDMCKEYLQEMSQEALKNKKSLLQKLQSEYATSAPTDTLQLNNVLAELQTHAVNWDLKYIDFARKFVRPERELRRLTTNHLRRMFPAENLYNSTNSTPVVSNLNLRTKRAIEAADLPLLDVGLDDSPSTSPYGVSNTVNTSESSYPISMALKEQPGLGESPTDTYPWFDEVKRFDQMFMQDNKDEDGKNFSTSIGSIAKKKFSSDDIMNSTPSSPGTSNNKRQNSVDNDDSHDLDPSVARRLSLELMKDAPKKKKEQVEDKKQQKQQLLEQKQQQQQEQQQQLQKQRYLQKSHIVESRRSPSPPTPVSSSTEFIDLPEPEETDYNARKKRMELDEYNNQQNSSRLIRHAAGIPILSSTAYKRFAGLLPDPIVGKSKSSPSPGNSLENHPKPISPYQKLIEMNNFRNSRKSQFYEPSFNVYSNASSSSAATPPVPPPPPPPQAPKPNFYRGSPYTAKLQDRSSIAFRYGFMGPPSNALPPILPVIDKKLGLNTHSNNPMKVSGTNSTALIPYVTKTTTPSQSAQQSISVTQDASVVRPRSRTMAIVAGASTGNLLIYHQQNKNTNRGRIPVPSSNFLNPPSVADRPSTPSIKFSNHLTIGNSSGHQQSHLPVPIHHQYHHGRKLSEGKIRNIRQRLPSKASLEPYTKIKEIIATHDESSSSSEDEGISDDDEDEDGEVDEDDIEGSFSENGDALLPFQHKTFSLMYTDEYDESLGREMVPSILELQQFNREHQLQMARNTLPYLSVDSGMVVSSRKSTHDEGGSFSDHLMTKSLSRNAIMEAVLRSSTNSSITLDANSASSGLEWPPTNGGGKNSIMKAITYVLAEKSISNLLPLEYPFSPTEHIFGDSNILVREDEPSSIISYMLGSTFYNEKLHRKRELRMSKAAGSSTSNIFTDNEKEKEKSDQNVTEESTNQQESKPFFLEMFPETDERERPWKFSFKGGSTSFTCKIYFAEQFDMLRKSCGCDEIFISSLARCTTWDTDGGKSGSIFLKTKDERFLIKQISKYEMDAFLGSANKYFLYMFNEVFDKGIPTVLCKIFGLYRIGFYNNVSGKSMKLDILVMENLFYETSVKRVYDLKGSMRNRWAEKTGKDVEVFLDENLVEVISKTPLYMRVDTKYNLSDSLFNDTQFLLNLDVMDYSLLVGFDEDTNEIIVGIVDFIRTFTWDKKLESWVKESGMLGGGKKDPTIVSPRMYRRRFRSAIDLYFCMIPDFWTICP
ncbi:hypothetical protein HPULCUR_005239 [Helicostylum pulchrum]|uniref:1-phosphatidylinositol-3-phosphate 5-kinase n=1 Tax=Helicostylum pulchrum TaxID=562976 RepID=A0ABP9XZT1_9FUNG